MYISSTQNDKVKYLRKLINDKDFRKTENCFVCEGKRLIDSIPNNWIIKELFVKVSINFDIKACNNSPIYVVKDEILDSVSDVKTSSGIIAVVELKERFVKPSGDIVLVLDRISDPGNLGTIIRTAASQGIKDLVLIDCVDCYSPKVIRSSMGGIFFVNLIKTSLDNLQEVISGYSLLTLDMGGENIYQFKYEDDKIALCVGNEANGVCDYIINNSKAILSIPIKNIESLNAAVSMSAAIFILNKEFKK